MATKISTIYTLITADDAPLRRGLKRANKEAIKGAKRIQGSLNKINFRAIGIGATAAAVSIGLAIQKFTSLAMEQEAVEKRLGAVLKSTGQAAGYNLSQLKKMASAMQQVTTTGDEVILSGMSMMATFKKVRGEAFERATMAALDMSEVMQQDLRPSIIMIGKALNDPVANLGALSRAGVQFEPAQKALIKSLWEVGRAAEAQGIILKELEGQMGGSAKAARDTFGGALKALGNDLGDIGETIGFSLMPPIKSVVDKLNEWLVLNEDFLEQDLPGHVSRIADAFGKVALAMGSIAKYAGLRSIMGTVAEGADLAAKGLIEWDDFISSSYLKRQQMVDDALKQLKAFGVVSKKINEETIGYAGYIASSASSRTRGGRGGAGGAGGPAAAAEKKPWEKAWTQSDYDELKARAVMQEVEMAEDKLAIYIEESNREIEREKYALEEKARLEEDAMKEATKLAEKEAKRMHELTKTVAGGMKDSFTELFTDTLKGEFKSFGDYVGGILDGLLSTAQDIMSQLLSRQAAGGAGGGVWGGIMAAFMHKGGVVGNTRGGRRVDASNFIGAPRLHGGLASDEFPAILQRGETVIPKSGPQFAVSVPINITGGVGSGVVNRLRKEIEEVATNVLREEMR